MGMMQALATITIGEGVIITLLIVLLVRARSS